MFEYFKEVIPEFKKTSEKLEREYPYTEYDKSIDADIAMSEANYEEGRHDPTNR